MPLPPEYIELLTAVVNCVAAAADSQPSLHTANEITTWLHTVSPRDVHQTTNAGSDERMNRLVRCLIEQTHDARLADWTPEQIADWCHRTRPEDVQAVLGEDSAASASQFD